MNSLLRDNNTIREKLTYLLRKFRLGHANRRAEKYFSNLSQDVRDAMSNSTSTGAGWHDYMYLHRFILRKKPKNVLEFGSGVTSLFIADALSSYGGHLVTLEDQPQRADEIRSLIPSRLQPFVTVENPKKVVDTWNKREGVRYEKLPDGKFELVYVDGPSETLSDGRKVLNLDILYYLEGHPDHRCNVIFDGKINTFYFIRARLDARCRGHKSTFDHGLDIGVLNDIAVSDLY